jgi:hypothetical protein
VRFEKHLYKIVFTEQEKIDKGLPFKTESEIIAEFSLPGAEFVFKQKRPEMKIMSSYFYKRLDTDEKNS